MGIKMNVDANLVIEKLSDQIGKLSLNIAMKDTQIEILQKQIAELSAKKDEVK